LPAIFTGLKVGAALAATAAVVAEFVASDEGWATLLLQYNGQARNADGVRDHRAAVADRLAVYYLVE
jgi:NitT/TauT family transport system permease protein